MARDRVTLRQLVDVGLVELTLKVRGRQGPHEFAGAITSAQDEVILTDPGISRRSLTAVADYAKATLSGYPLGEYPTANGWPRANDWEFCEYQDSNGVWEPLDTLRKRYNKR